MCTTILSVLINPSSRNVHTKVLHTDFNKFSHIHTIHIYILYCFLPEETFQEGYFLKRCAIQFFSNLVQLTAIHTTLKKLQQKDGVTVIVVALHARNSRCFFQFRQKFFSYSKNDESYYYSLFVFLSFNFSVK